MIGLLWLGCVGSETLNTQNVTEPSADVLGNISVPPSLSDQFASYKRGGD